MTRRILTILTALVIVAVIWALLYGVNSVGASMPPVLAHHCTPQTPQYCPPTDTPRPSDTPQPTATHTPPFTATNTAVPSDTPTEQPTATGTVTPTRSPEVTPDPCEQGCVPFVAASPTPYPTPTETPCPVCGTHVDEVLVPDTVGGYSMQAELTDASLRRWRLVVSTAPFDLECPSGISFAADRMHNGYYQYWGGRECIPARYMIDYGACVLTPDEVHRYWLNGTQVELFPGQVVFEISHALENAGFADAGDLSMRLITGFREWGWFETEVK